MTRQVGTTTRPDDAITRRDLEAAVGTPIQRISIGPSNQLTPGYTGIWWKTDQAGVIIDLLIETSGQDAPPGSRVSVGPTNGLPGGTKGIWAQTDSSGNLVTLWVETAGT